MIKLANRIILTEVCDEKCEHCFNANFRKKKIMDHRIFVNFMRFNHNFLITSVLKVMGGEPTLHPYFLDFLKESLLHYGRVDVFTNGNRMKEITKDPIFLKYHYINRLKYIINGYTFNIEKFYEYSDFIKDVTIHCVISPHSYNDLIEKISKILDLGPQIFLTVSPDTQVNVFDSSILKNYRNIWVESIIRISEECRKRGKIFCYDHNLPICFFTQEMRDNLNSRSSINVQELVGGVSGCCCENQIGLIGTDFELTFCNQTNIKIGKIINEDGSPKSIPEIIEMIKSYPQKKVQKIMELSEMCKKCNVLSGCKVGCYFNVLDLEGRKKDESEKN